ncbi:hypothetical protein [Streptomyces californicus]|uniref:hypothetical protein n=1 Tax=Streptomyces californicus TaxID=67351 RepID=UPI0033EACE52
MEIEAAVRAGRDISELEGAQLYFDHLEACIQAAVSRQGGDPSVEQLLEELDRSAVLRGLSKAGLEALLVSKTRHLVKGRRALATERAKRDRISRRRVDFALWFLPAGERGHYSQEWHAEMAVMPSREAARFSLNLLVRAPRSGLTLHLQKIFGRLVA